MPLKLSPHDSTVEAAARERLRALLADQEQVTPIFGDQVDPAGATLIAPHVGYVADHERLQAGDLLGPARPFALRYLIAVEPEGAGAVELAPVEGEQPPSVSRIGAGPGDVALLAALRDARRELADVEEDVEPRFLLAPTLHFAALWLHGPTDRLVPLLPDAEGPIAEQAYHEEEIAPILRRLAEPNPTRPTRRRTVTGSDATDPAELPYLSQANYLGQGFDITGTYALPESLILPVVDANKAKWDEFEFQGKKFSVPSFCEATPDTNAQLFEKAFSTREELQNSFAATAKVAGGYGAFSGEMDVAYGQDVTSSSEYDYAYVNYYARLAALKLDLNAARTMLTRDFIERYEELPAELSEKTLAEFELFFFDYGMYVTSMVTLGGSLEYTVAVNKESKSSLTSIKASVKAEYKGVLVSGEISGSISNTDEWKRYRQNRSVKLAVNGGDPSMVSELMRANVDAPSSQTVNAYQGWLKSLGGATAVADFYLTGVWELIPDKTKRELVRKAFTALQGTMRPRLTIETNWQAGWPPTITLGKSIRPEDPPEKPAGYQLVMIDRSNLSRIVLDKYYTVETNAIYAKYAALYDEIAADIEEGGFDHPGMVMVLASFGVSWGAPPNARLLPLLRSFGAGSRLSLWLQKATPGRNMDLRCVYALIGVGGLGPGTGIEVLHEARGRQVEELEVFFYRARGVSLYAPSVGKSSADVAAGVEEGDSGSFVVAGPEQAYVEDVDE